MSVWVGAVLPVAAVGRAAIPAGNGHQSRGGDGTRGGSIGVELAAVVMARPSQLDPVVG